MDFTELRQQITDDVVEKTRKHAKVVEEQYDQLSKRRTELSFTTYNTEEQRKELRKEYVQICYDIDQLEPILNFLNAVENNIKLLYEEHSFDIDYGLFE